MTEERGALIEAMARAIFAAQWEAGPLSEEGPPDFGRGGFKTEVVSWTAAAQAALTAISNAGYAVTPIEPTRLMIAKAWDEISKEKRLLGIAKLGPGPAAREVYRAMIKANPLTTKGTGE